MDPNATYVKTDKGQQEVQSRAYGLPLRSRTLLIMVDGRATAGMIIDKGKAAGNASAYTAMQELEAQGFIVAASTGAPVESGTPERSLASARRYAIAQMRALPGPHGPAFVERLESAADRGTLVTMLERCRNAVQVATNEEGAKRFWAGVEARLP